MDQDARGGARLSAIKRVPAGISLATWTYTCSSALVVSTLFGMVRWWVTRRAMQESHGMIGLAGGGDVGPPLHWFNCPQSHDCAAAVMVPSGWHPENITAGIVQLVVAILSFLFWVLSYDPPRKGLAGNLGVIYLLVAMTNLISGTPLSVRIVGERPFVNLPIELMIRLVFVGAATRAVLDAAAEERECSACGPNEPAAPLVQYRVIVEVMIAAVGPGLLRLCNPSSPLRRILMVTVFLGCGVVTQAYFEVVLSHVTQALEARTRPLLARMPPSPISQTEARGSAPLMRAVRALRAWLKPTPRSQSGVHAAESSPHICDSGFPAQARTDVGTAQTPSGVPRTLPAAEAPASTPTSDPAFEQWRTRILRRLFIVNSSITVLWLFIELLYEHSPSMRFAKIIELLLLTVETGVIIIVPQVFMTSSLMGVVDRQQLAARLVLAERIAKVEAGASAARSKFLRTTFHEARVPLSSITLGLEYLCGSDEVTGDTKEVVQMMRTAADSITTIMNNVLTLSAIDAGGLRILPAPSSLRDVFATLEFQMRPWANGINVQLVTEIDAAVPDWLLFDRTRVLQVCSNLVNNALKFVNQAGSGRVLIRAKVVDTKVAEGTINIDPRVMGPFTALPQLARIRIEVADNGCGLSPEDQAKLFRPFSQVLGAASVRHQGTGLGLTIVKEIVEKHGGTIAVQSQPGIGSTFSFEIPCRVLQDTTRAPANADQLGSVAAVTSKTPSPASAVSFTRSDSSSSKVTVSPMEAQTQHTVVTASLPTPATRSPGQSAVILPGPAGPMFALVRPANCGETVRSPRVGGSAPGNRDHDLNSVAVTEPLADPAIARKPGARGELSVGRAAPPTPQAPWAPRGVYTPSGSPCLFSPCASIASRSSETSRSVGRRPSDDYNAPRRRGQTRAALGTPARPVEGVVHVAPALSPAHAGAARKLLHVSDEDGASHSAAAAAAPQQRVLRVDTFPGTPEGSAISRTPRGPMPSPLRSPALLRYTASRGQDHGGIHRAPHRQHTPQGALAGQGRPPTGSEGSASNCTEMSESPPFLQSADGNTTVPVTGMQSAAATSAGAPITPGSIGAATVAAAAAVALPRYLQPTTVEVLPSVPESGSTPTEGRTPRESSDDSPAGCIEASMPRGHRNRAQTSDPALLSGPSASSLNAPSADGESPDMLTPASGASVHPAPNGPSGVGSAGSAGLRFLIVDDTQSNRRLLMRVLKTRYKHATYFEAVDGQQAIDMVATHGPGAFDVIVMDANMPGVDGLAATQQLRRMGVRSTIVGCTGNAFEEDVKAFRTSGADCVLVKPVSLRAITAAIDKAATSEPRAESRTKPQSPR